MRLRMIAAVLAGVAVLTAACGGNTDGDRAAPDGDPAATVEVAGAVETATTVAPTAPLYSEDDLAAFPDADTDHSFPSVAPDTPVGVYGFSRYVWTATPEGDVVPTLIEGPRGRQLRCQDEALPCSMDELAALADSGEPIPPELGLDQDDLDELVAQLQQLRDHLATITSIEQACAQSRHLTVRDSCAYFSSAGKSPGT